MGILDLGQYEPNNYILDGNGEGIENLKLKIREQTNHKKNRLWNRINWEGVAVTAILIACGFTIFGVCVFVFDRIAFWFLVK